MLGRSRISRSNSRLRRHKRIRGTFKCCAGNGGFRSGLSFIELTTVVLIIAILSAIAVPRISQSVSEQRVHSAAQRLAADIEFAKSQAKTLGRTVSVTFQSNQRGYSIDVDAPDGGGTYAAELTDVTVSATLSGAATTLDFDVYGTPSAATTATLSSGSHSATVTVSASGAPPVVDCCSS